MHPPALPVEQPMLIPSFLVILPVDDAAVWHEGLKGIEVGK
jgi:hypothetical protein